MGMFDWYEPRPDVACPQCGAMLADWQGKDGPCALFAWTQGFLSPTEQRVDEECAIAPSARARFRLPDEFDLYTSCDSCKLWIDAHGSCESSIWNRTDLVRPLALPGLPEGWNVIGYDDRIHVLAELRREVPQGHALEGRRLLPLARRIDRDEVLVQELRSDGLVWVVHLTWKPASNPTFPAARSFANLLAFVESSETD